MKMNKAVAMFAALGVVAAPVFAGSGVGGGGGAGKVSVHDISVVVANWFFTPSSPTTINSGVLRLEARAVPSAVAALCQSHATIPSMTIESDGQRREYRNVVFKDCPAGGDGTFTLTVSGQPAAASSAAATSLREVPNVTIHGLGRMSCQNNLKQIGLAAHSATIYVGSANGGVWKTTNGGQLLPRVVIEGKGGMQVAFMDASVREISRASEPDVLKITLDFKSTTATPQLVEAILAGR